MDLLLAATEAGLQGAGPVLAAEEAGGGLVLNWFWIVLSAGNFLVLLVLLTALAYKPLGRILDERRARIEQGLRDAEQARLERERAADERTAALVEARREANEVLARAQKIADESAAQLVATAREESHKIIERGRADVAAEKDRAIAEIRAEVADLAIMAAGKVVGESLDGPRQRRLVQRFLAETPGNERRQD